MGKSKIIRCFGSQYIFKNYVSSLVKINLSECTQGSHLGEMTFYAVVNVETRCRYVDRLTPRLLYPWEKDYF